MKTWKLIGNVLALIAGFGMLILGCIYWFIEDDFIKGGIAMLLSLAYVNTSKTPAA